jgi:hypothetical protein
VSVGEGEIIQRGLPPLDECLREIIMRKRLRVRPNVAGGDKDIPNLSKNNWSSASPNFRME